MTIELTEQQQQALSTTPGELARVFNPRTKAAYVLVPAEEYENVRELLEEEKRQAAIHAAALRNAMGRMNEEP
jgi:hypothetical protein